MSTKKTKAENREKKKKKMGVSGKTVFGIQKIIQKKSANK